jgi:hypothetical protein
MHATRHDRVDPARDLARAAEEEVGLVVVVDVVDDVILVEVVAPWQHLVRARQQHGHLSLGALLSPRRQIVEQS